MHRMEESGDARVTATTITQTSTVTNWAMPLMISKTVAKWKHRGHERVIQVQPMQSAVHPSSLHASTSAVPNGHLPKLSTKSIMPKTVNRIRNVSLNPSSRRPSVMPQTHIELAADLHMKLGLTRQLAFGPWDHEQNERRPIQKLQRFIQKQKMACLLFLFFVLVVCSLLYFFAKERDVDLKLMKMYGWSKDWRTNRRAVETMAKASTS